MSFLNGPKLLNPEPSIYRQSRSGPQATFFFSSTNSIELLFPKNAEIDANKRATSGDDTNLRPLKFFKIKKNNENSKSKSKKKCMSHEQAKPRI